MHVRNLALAGTIATCPACGAMVQIPEKDSIPNIRNNPVQDNPVPDNQNELAQRPLRYGSDSIESGEVTGEVNQNVSEQVGGEAFDRGPTIRGVGQPPGRPDDRETAPPTMRGAPPIESSANQSSASDSSVVPPSQLPEIEFQSESAKRARQIAAIVAGSILAIIVLAVVVIGWWSSSEKIADSGSSTEPRVQEQEKAPEQKGPGLESTPPSDAEPVVAPEIGPGPSNVDQTSQPDRPPITDPDAVDSAATDPTATDVGASNLESSDSPSPATDSTVSKPPNGLTPLAGPLDLFSLPTTPKSDDGPAVDPDAPSLEALPAGLDSFTPLLLGIDPSPETDLDAPPTLDDFRLSEASRDDGPLIQGDLVVIRPKKDLAIKVAISAKTKTVSRLVQLVSQISGVPIEIDLVAFDLAGIDVRRTMTPQPTVRPLHEILDEIAQSIDGIVVSKTTYLAITPAREIFEKRIESSIKTDGLAGASEIIDRLIPVVDESKNGLLPPEAGKIDDGQKGDIDLDDPAPGDPAQDDAADGDDLVIPPGRENQMLRAILTQSLRQMRGLDPTIDPAALSRWSGRIGEAGLQWPLIESPPTEQSSLFPVTIAEFFGQLEIASEKTLLVFWPDLLKREWSASDLVFPDAELDPPTFVQRTLAPVQCHVRKIDDQFAWVGNDATYDRLPVVVYATDLKKDQRSIINQLRQAAAVADSGAIRWSLDPISDGILMVVPRFVAVQLTR